MTLNIEDIMADFRRNGRDSEYIATQSTTEWHLPYDLTAPWSVWHASDPQYNKGGGVDSQMKLVRALSALDVSGSRPASVSPFPPSRAHLAQQPSGNLDYLGLLDESLFASSPAGSLAIQQGNPGQSQSEAFLNLVQEKAQQLSQNRRPMRSHDVGSWRSFDLAAKQMVAAHEPLASMYPLPRNLGSKPRTAYWERQSGARLAQRRNAVLRETICDPRSCQHVKSHRPVFGRSVFTKRESNSDLEKSKGATLETQQQVKIQLPKNTSAGPPTPDASVAGEVKVEPKPNSPVITSIPSAKESKSGPRAPSQSAPGTPTTEGPPTLPTLAAVTAQARLGGGASSSSGAGAGAGAAKESGRSKKSHPRRRRYSNESPASLSCAFCKKNGEAPSVYRTHVAKSADGRTVCRVLQKYVCPLCGATGENAHTVKHCPKNLNPHCSPAERPARTRNSLSRFEMSHF